MTTTRTTTIAPNLRTERFPMIFPFTAAPSRAALRVIYIEMGPRWLGFAGKMR